MGDKRQLLSQGKTPGDDERGVGPGPGDPAGHAISSPDHRTKWPPDSHKCRECLTAVAHRLAQTITALRGGIELGLMGKHSAAEYRSLLEQSLQLADNMAQLIVSLRELGELSASGGPPQCVHLEATIQEILAEMAAVAESRGLLLRLTAEGIIKVCADPERLREAFQNLLAWVIQSSAGEGTIGVELSAAEGEAQVSVVPPRLDLQYLQIKVLEDITTPGLLFSHAAKNGTLGWAINQRQINRLGGKLEILTDGLDAGSIRVHLPLAPPLEAEKLS